MKQIRFCFIVMLFLCPLTHVCAQATHPVYFKILTPGTLYGDAVRQAVFCDSLIDENDPILLANHNINRILVQTFVDKPWLFTTTQTSISNQQTMDDVLVTDSIVEDNQELSALVAMDSTVPEEEVELDVEVKKPNFWKFDGNASLQFTQNHFSENWYQGGDNHYSMLALMKLHLKYDNQQKIQWETTLDAKLGFQTVDNDEFRKFRANNDQIRLTTKFGYAAFKHWYYTFQGQTETQFCKTYEPNSRNVIGDFTSPIKTVLSVGMDYKWNIKRFSGSAYLAPLAMTWVYVDRLDLATRYGNDEGKRDKITWGPNVTVSFKWTPWDNISWESRIYWFSNFHYTNIEWENTFSFKFNKFISAKLFLQPRFDDSSESYMTEGGSYFMFKEWLSVGLDYSF